MRLGERGGMDDDGDGGGDEDGDARNGYGRMQVPMWVRIR